MCIRDSIRSLHNIGSVFRTADAFRIECIYLCGITATPPHPEMHKTALGAEFTVDWKYVNNAVETVDNLRSEGYVVYSVEQAEGSIMLDELTPVSYTHLDVYKRQPYSLFGQYNGKLVSGFGYRTCQ